MTDNENLVWMFWCRGLTLERWREECRLVEERLSLFRSFAELPFLGFRGVVARAGREYEVIVAAEMVFIRNTCLGHLSLPPLWVLGRMGSYFLTSFGGLIPRLRT